MHSNAQLRTVVAKQLAKEDEKYKAKRPDFVCGTVDRKLIIIEREPDTESGEPTGRPSPTPSLRTPSQEIVAGDVAELERRGSLGRPRDGSYRRPVLRRVRSVTRAG